MGEITIKAGDCPNSIGALLQETSSSYTARAPRTCLTLCVEREDPCPSEDGTDYGFTFIWWCALDIKVEPTKAAWSVFEQAIYELAELDGELMFGPEVTDYSAGFQVMQTGENYWGDLPKVKDSRELASLHSTDVALEGSKFWHMLSNSEDLCDPSWIRYVFTEDSDDGGPGWCRITE